jgi:hydrogenase maturation protein HypF
MTGTRAGGEGLGPALSGAVSEGRVARIVEVRGLVQGVGFRPFVWRLANELGLDGTVRNQAGQVEIVVTGTGEAVEAFAGRLRTDAPPRARVEAVLVRDADPGRLPPRGAGFTIDES